VEELDVVFPEQLQGGILIPHVGGEGADRELRAGTDEVDFFSAGHDAGSLNFERMSLKSCFGEPEKRSCELLVSGSLESLDPCSDESKDG